MQDEPEPRAARVLKELAGITIWEAIRSLLIVIFTGSSAYIASKVITAVWSVLAPYQVWITVSLISGALLTLGYFYQRLNRFHPRFSPLDCDFRVLEKEITFEYRDRTHISYRKKLVLRALKKGLESYHDKYHWTGSLIHSIRSSIQEQDVHLTIRKNVWQLYEIRFQQTLAKGDEIETEVIWELEDPEQRAVPFFSATIDEPTDRLILHLSVPPEMGIRQVVEEVSSTIVTKKASSSKSMNVDRNGVVHWTILNPKLFHHYEIKWVRPRTEQALPENLMVDVKNVEKN